MINKGILDPRNQRPPAFIEKAAKLGLSVSAARRILGAAIGRGDIEAANWMADGIIPKRLAGFFQELPTLKQQKTVVSQVDGFQKMLFGTHDHLPIETVIIPLHKEGCVSICLSSQVGCVMGCTFCATARMPKRRNLKTWEIVDQFIQARKVVQAMGKRVSGVVFMGMGEPFLNYDNVMAAAEIFCFPLLNAINAKAITISTVGLLPEIKRFTIEQRPFRLSISLGAASDQKRAKLVPLAAKTPLADVMAAARNYALKNRTRVMLSYVCIGNENVFEEDARALGDLIKDTPVRLDLIEVTDTIGRYRRPTEGEMNNFRDALRRYVGQPVARRYSGGADINAACGTLAGSL